MRLIYGGERMGLMFTQMPYTSEWQRKNVIQVFVGAFRGFAGLFKVLLCSIFCDKIPLGYFPEVFYFVCINVGEIPTDRSYFWRN